MAQYDRYIHTLESIVSYQQKLVLLFTLVLVSTGVSAQELPQANRENSFYILPLNEKSFPDTTSYEEKEVQYLKIKSELGVGNLYHRLGFSFIYNSSLDEAYHDDFILAKKYGLHLGLIFSLQSHTRDVSMQLKVNNN